jgi:hypothetical protein
VRVAVKCEVHRQGRQPLELSIRAEESALRPGAEIRAEC